MASADPHCSEAMNSPLQNALKEIEKILVTNRFATERSLDIGTESSYAAVIGMPFIQELLAAGPGFRWTDIGMGEGKAQLGLAKSPQFYDPRIKMRGIAIRFPWDRVTPKSRQSLEALIAAGRLEIIERNLFDLPPDKKGSEDLVSDVFAAITYHHELDKTLHAAIDLLVPGGKFYSSAVIRAMGEGCLRIFDSSGKDLPLNGYLAQIEGVALLREREFLLDSEQELHQFSLKRTEGEIRVPPLKLIEALPPVLPPEAGPRVPCYTYKMI